MAKRKSVVSKIIPIIILIVIIVVSVGLIIYYNKLNKIVYNEMSSANGNTPGNLQNGGYFCELDNTVYFRNPFDKGRLYAMDSNGENVRKLNGETVSSINAYGKYLYFSKNNLTSTKSTAAFRGTLFSAMRSNLDGKNVVSLSSDYSGVLTLVGNKVFFQHYESNDEQQTLGSLYSVGIDKADLHEVVKSDISPAGVFGTYIFYAGVEGDHNIYRLNTLTDSSTLFYEGNCYMCIPDGHYLYFLDADDGYKLKRTSSSSSKSEAETVISERVATYNVSSNYIYFQIDDDKGKLCRIGKNKIGEEYDVITTGHYEKINVTSKFVYFYKVNNDTDAYRVPTTGAAKIEKLSEVFDMSIYK